MTEEKRIRFLKNLNQADVEKKVEAIDVLGELADPHIFKILSGYFSEPHPAVREALFRAFTREKTRQVAEIVADTLYSPQISVRSLAMEILREIGPESLLPLRRLMKNPKAEIRKIAAELIADIAHPQSGLYLIHLLDDPDRQVVECAIKGLGKLHEISAVPLLHELIQKEVELQPLILSSLTKIFLHWENRIIQEEYLATDPIAAFEFLTTIQENGNSNSLNLLLQWLRFNAREMGDELLKALSSIFRKNPQVMLPSYFITTIQKVWKEFSEQIPLEDYLLCLSHLPSTAALEKLLEYFQQNTHRFQIFLYRFVENFPGIYFAKYPEIPREINLQVLRYLTWKNSRIQEPYLLHLYRKAKNREEQDLLLQLATQNQIPEAKKILLENISLKNRSRLEKLLEGLLYYRDDSLWNLYLKFLDHSRQTVRNLALKGVLQYPQLTVDYLRTKIDQVSESEKLFLFQLGSLLPLKNWVSFLQSWVAKADEQKLLLLQKFLRENNNQAFIPVVAHLLRTRLQEADSLFNALHPEVPQLNITSGVQHYLCRIPLDEFYQTMDLLRPYWKREVEEWTEKRQKKEEASFEGYETRLNFQAAG